MVGRRGFSGHRYSFVRRVLIAICCTLALAIARNGFADSGADPYARGVSAMQKGNYDLAVASFSDAIRLNPNAASAYTYRGLAYASRDQADLAIADFTDAIKQPDSGEAHTYRGIVYHRRGEYALAIGDYSAAVESQPWNVAARLNRATAYDAIGDRTRATADIDEVLRTDPDNA